MITLDYRDPRAGVFTAKYSLHLALVCMLAQTDEEKLQPLLLLRENSAFVEERRAAFVAKYGNVRFVLDEDEE
jgi:hypothetical protein